MPNMFHGLHQVSHALQGFEELKKKRKFYDKLLANIGASGFTTPTPIQRQVLPLLLRHREVLAVAPTGDFCDKPTHPVAHSISCQLRLLHRLNHCSQGWLCVGRKVPGRHWRTLYPSSYMPRWPP